MNEIIFPPGESFSSPCILFRFYHIALPFSYLESSLFGSVISVVVQWLRLHASSAGVTGSIPGQGTGVPHGIGHAPPKKKIEKAFCMDSRCLLLGFPGGSDGKESARNAGDLGSSPGSGRSPREGSGYPLQYSCLENSMDRGAWRATVHGVTKSWTRQSD